MVELNCTVYCKSPPCGPKTTKISPCTVFPKYRELRLRWLNAINRPEFKPKNGSRICSHHFNGYDINNYTLSRQHLKFDACPFLRIPISSNMHTSEKF